MTTSAVKLHVFPHIAELRPAAAAVCDRITNLEDSRSGQTTIVGSTITGESTNVILTQSVAYLPDVVSTESSRYSYDYPLMWDDIVTSGRSGPSTWVNQPDSTSSSNSSVMSLTDANIQREAPERRHRIEGPRPYVNVNPTTIGLLHETGSSHESIDNSGRRGTCIYHQSPTTSSSSSVVSQSDTESQRKGHRMKGRRSYINVSQTTADLLRSANPVRPDLAPLTNCSSWSNRHLRQQKWRRGTRPSMKGFSEDDALVPLRADHVDDSCDYINIRCSAEYLHQRSWSPVHSHRNSQSLLPGVHLGSLETPLYANIGDLRIAPPRYQNYRS